MATLSLGGAKPSHRRQGTIRFGLLVLLVLALHAVLVADSILKHSLTVDEGGHVLSGVTYWRQGTFRVYSVNPPLVKWLFAAPVAAAEAEFPTNSEVEQAERWSSLHRPFIRRNLDSYMGLIFRARFVVLLLSLVGALVVYAWSSSLFGKTSGLIALTLWSLCPNVLAHAGLATIDVGGTTIGLLALFVFRRYLTRPTMLAAAVAGFVLGLAELSKFTWLVLYPTCILLWILGPLRSTFLRQGYALGTTLPVEGRRWFVLLDPLVGFLVSWFVINAGYGFQGTGRPLGEFFFRSRALAGYSIEPTSWSPETGGNRFRDTWMERLPVPLPSDYIQGMDEQKAHPDIHLRSYLRGEWSRDGWWFYYLYGSAVKVPLGTWMIGLLTLFLAWWARRFRHSWLEELTVWLPALLILVLVSSQTGLNAHFRYVLPVLALAIIGISRVGRVFEQEQKELPAESKRSESDAVMPGNVSESLARGTSSDTPEVAGHPIGRLEQCSAKPHLALMPICAVLVLAAVGWNGVSVLRNHPHHLSYFSELAGGPDRGGEHLLDSNIDWGQDLFFLKAWLDLHQEARPVGLAYFGSYDPHLLGLEYQLPPSGPGKRTRQFSQGVPTFEDVGPQPGWFALSANFVYGMSFTTYDERGQVVVVPDGAYRYFQYLQPVAKAGRSIFIYHLSTEEAADIRERLGLARLPGHRRQ